jgi:hypothetical protein
MITHADRALPADHRGGPRPRAGVAAAWSSAGAADPRKPFAGTLHVLDGPDRGRVWRLSPGTHLLGLSPQCDLSVTDPEVSRWHCMVAVTSDAGGRPGRVTVEDRGSEGGTEVDGSPAGRPSVLAPGSTIVVGRTTLGWAPAGWSPNPSPAPVPGAPVPALVAPPVPPHQPVPFHPAAPVRAPGPTTEPTPRPWERWLRTAAPPRPTSKSTVLATLTSLAALAALAGAGLLTGLPLLIPPLAASMALIAGGTALPLAQPRNVMGGQVVSALAGFAVVALIGPGGWAAALAGALALGAMLVLRVSHSPAAATAVIVGATAPSVLPFMGLLVLAVVVLVAFGIVGARLEGKKYPVYWW